MAENNIIKPAAPVVQTSKYLIQTGTGDVYHWSRHLAARSDMNVYDEDILGPVVDGKSSNLVKKAKADAAKAAGKKAAE